MSWHEFGQTALRPRDDTKISYTDALARAREKSLGKILLRLERQRERERKRRASILPLPFSGNLFTDNAIGKRSVYAKEI